MTKNELIELAYEKLELHSLIVEGWTIETIDSASFYGDCNETTKVIRLSDFLAITEAYESTLDTILHEIAHALVGCWHLHDLVWKAKAKEIGANPASTRDFHEDTEAAILAQKTKYVMAYKGKIVKAYQRKPNKKTILGIKAWYITGRKLETVGKLTIQVFDARIHKGYV